MAESKKKGKVFIQTTTGDIVPFAKLHQAEIKKDSKQAEQVPKWLAQMQLIPPPYPPSSFLQLYESNAIFFRCVNQIATDVAGLGWKLQLQEGKEESKNERTRLMALLERPNPDEALRTILRKLLIDLGVIGWFGLEVVRDNTGEISDIYHVPAYTFRIHSSKKKFCQNRNQKKVWFKKFGEKKDINSKDGKIGTHNIKTRANELIYYRNFYPKSDYYGVPNILPAVGDVMGLIGARDYNLDFFENFGIPSAMIVLEGDWDEDSDKKISNFLATELKGSGNRHKTLVVTQPDGCKFVYTPLESKQVKDSSFRLYEITRRDDVLIANSMPPERVGIRVTGKLGGNVAEEATKIYTQGVVEPLQLDIEDIINRQLYPSEIYQFKFNDIDTRNLDSLVKRINSEIEHGMKTPNEGRNELGMKPYPEGDKYFMMSSLIEGGTPPDDGLLSKSEMDGLEPEEI